MGVSGDSRRNDTGELSMPNTQHHVPLPPPPPPVPPPAPPVPPPPVVTVIHVTDNNKAYGVLQNGPVKLVIDGHDVEFNLTDPTGPTNATANGAHVDLSLIGPVDNVILNGAFDTAKITDPNGANVVINGAHDVVDLHGDHFSVEVGGKGAVVNLFGKGDVIKFDASLLQDPQGQGPHQDHHGNGPLDFLSGMFGGHNPFDLGWQGFNNHFQPPTPTVEIQGFTPSDTLDLSALAGNGNHGGHGNYAVEVRLGNDTWILVEQGNSHHQGGGHDQFDHWFQPQGYGANQYKQELFASAVTTVKLDGVHGNDVHVTGIQLDNGGQGFFGKGFDSHFLG